MYLQHQTGNGFGLAFDIIEHITFKFENIEEVVQVGFAIENVSIFVYLAIIVFLFVTFVGYFTYNSFYFFEEILSTEPHKKRILVSDRATLFNLLIGLNGYTTCTGVLNRNLNGDNIVAVRLRTDENMLVGYITSERQSPGACATRFLEELKRLIAADGFEVLS